MANYIEETDLDAKRFVPISSRYANEVVVYKTDNKLLTFKTYKKTITPSSDRDVYAVISPGSEYRPDLVSQKAYGTPDFWWKILEANNIKDIFDFKSGLNIKIPDAILL